MRASVASAPGRAASGAPAARLVAALLLWLAAGLPAASAAEPRGQILWDRYGVPHVYAADEASLFYGFGWAQARNHGNLLLRLYGEARARAAEYWGGEANLESDRYLLANDVPARAERWYAAQTPAFRRDLDAFAAGINAYVAAHGTEIDDAVERVLPLTGRDVVAHAHRLANFVYVAPAARVQGGGAAGEGEAGSEADDGSNGWALAPARAAGGATLMLQNPHLAWSEGPLTYMEAHLNAPGVHMYGATQVGLPVLRFMFNERIGITNTVNGAPAATVYELTVVDGGYRFDGAVRPFEVRRHTIRVRQPDGSLADEAFEVRSSVHGPVFTRRDGRTVALRVAGLDRPGFLQQYWDMGRSRSLDDFLRAMRRLQVPTFNILYADRAGHVAYVYNGIVPRHAGGDAAYWRGLVPGDGSSTLWHEVHDFDELPRVVDPPAGFVQNANDPPWLATFPAAIRAQDYPPYMAPPGPFSLRAQQSIGALAGPGRLAFDDFVARKNAVRAVLADRVLPELLAAATQDGDPALEPAIELLAAWNRSFDADSRAALLFETWAALFAGPRFTDESNYAVKWRPEEPLTTPRGLKDPAAAVAMLRQAIARTVERYGALDRPFGAVSRFRLRDVDLPGDSNLGGLGPLRVITWGPLVDGTRVPVHGETWVALLEFGARTRALGLMSYGNSTQPRSPHRSDQLALLAGHRYRELPLRRADVLPLAVERTTLGAPAPRTAAADAAGMAATATFPSRMTTRR